MRTLRILYSTKTIYGPTATSRWIEIRPSEVKLGYRCTKKNKVIIVFKKTNQDQNSNQKYVKTQADCNNTADPPMRETHITIADKHK